MSNALAIRDEQDYLVRVSEIRTLVERIENAGDAKALADKARAAQVWAQRARLGDEQVNLAAIAKLWAERRAGELLAAVRGHAKRLPNGTIPDGNISPKESHRWQKLAAVPVEDFEQAVDDAAQNGLVTTSGVVRRMDVHYSSATDLWSTPQDLYDQLRREFSFELDVCATADNAKCVRYFTSEDDGLSQEWNGVCWMNPPYGDAIKDWVRKAYESSTHGATVVCLVPARVDTGWWWDYCRFGEIRFLRGRLKFGGGANSAPFPSAVVIFGRPAQVIWWER